MFLSPTSGVATRNSRFFPPPSRGDPTTRAALIFSPEDARGAVQNKCGILSAVSMSFLNTQDRAELLAFIDSIVDYLPPEERERAFALLQEKQGAEPLSQAELAGQVLQHAVFTWPARRAVQRFVEAEGAEAEWTKLLETVRPTTAFLLKRLRERTGARSLGQVLGLPEIATVIQGEERTELELVRPEIWIELWQAQPETLASHTQEATKELQAMQQRLQKLEQFSAQSEKKAEVAEKIRDFQDRIYFRGESISLEKLNEELQLTIGDVLMPRGE